MTESIAADSGRAWVDVDLDALRDNARYVATRVRAPLLPMVKADGYGLGSVEVARALLPLAPYGFGVATPEEAATLRAAGLTLPIIAFAPLVPWSARACREAEAVPCIGDLEALDSWTTLGQAPFHVEIDTGMGRAGFRHDDLPLLERLRERLARAPGWEGIYTHFHSPEADPTSTRRQWERLHQAIASLGRRPRLIHAASSGGGFADPEYGADLARPGIFLYGGQVGSHQPRTVAAFRARVAALRRIPAGETVSYGATWMAPRATTIATIGAGYADGVHRALSSRGAVEINEQVHRIAGRVTMDLTMIDVGDAPVKVGDVATIWGGAVALDAQAARAGTISYELLTSLGHRVVRRYQGGA